MPDEPVWIAASEVIEFNAAVVAQTGERYLLRDHGLLVSAVALPRNLWAYGEADISAAAIGLMLAIARNHPFEQGNKRTGFVAMIAFLDRNNYSVDVEDSEDVAEFIIQVLSGRNTERELVDILASSIREQRPTGGAQQD